MARSLLGEVIVLKTFPFPHSGRENAVMNFATQQYLKIWAESEQNLLLITLPVHFAFDTTKC